MKKTATTINEILLIEKQRYREQGAYALVSAALCVAFFYGVPQFGKKFYCEDFNFANRSDLFYNFALWVVASGSYVLMCLSFFPLYFIPALQKNAFLSQYRINKDEKWPWEDKNKDWSQYKSAMVRSLVVNQLFVTPIVLTANYFLRIIRVRTDCESFPTVGEFTLNIVVAMLVEDTWSYWLHRLTHHPSIYKQIHKKHHEYNISYSFVTEYAHPLEFLVVNTGGLMSGVVLLASRMHTFTLWAWIVFRLYSTIDIHSGYEFPWSLQRIFPLSVAGAHHDFHHSSNSGNYGSFFYIWDFLCDTLGDYVNFMLKRARKAGGRIGRAKESSKKIKD